MKNGPHGLSRRPPGGPDPDFIAIQALTYIAGHPDHADRFMALTGIDVGDLRRVSAEPGFLLGVMDYLVGDEPLLLEFAAEAGIPPAAVVRAHDGLAHDGSAHDH